LCDRYSETQKRANDQSLLQDFAGPPINTTHWFPTGAEGSSDQFVIARDSWA
jgi:hypothetical protein